METSQGLSGFRRHHHEGFAYIHCEHQHFTSFALIPPAGCHAPSLPSCPLFTSVLGSLFYLYHHHFLDTTPLSSTLLFFLSFFSYISFFHSWFQLSSSCIIKPTCTIRNSSTTSLECSFPYVLYSTRLFVCYRPWIVTSTVNHMIIPIFVDAPVHPCHSIVLARITMIVTATTIPLVVLIAHVRTITWLVLASGIVRGVAHLAIVNGNRSVTIDTGEVSIVKQF